MELLIRTNRFGRDSRKGDRHPDLKIPDILLNGDYLRPVAAKRGTGIMCLASVTLELKTDRDLCQCSMWQLSGRPNSQHRSLV